MSTETESNDPVDIDSDEISGEDARYRCPICEETYSNEVITRVHITRSDDVHHRNYNGSMPETEVEVINSDGDVEKTLSRRPREIDHQSLSLEDFPDSKTDKQKHVLLTAARHPQLNIYTELTDKVNRQLEYHDFEAFSYSQIRRITRSFYQPQNENSGEEGGETPENHKRTLSDLTPKQQAILIARVAQPQTSNKGIADLIGCATSYPSQVFDQADSILRELEEKASDGKKPEEVVLNELDETEIADLVDRELLENVDIDLAEYAARKCDEQQMWVYQIEDDDSSEQTTTDSVDNGNSSVIESSETTQNNTRSAQRISKKEIEQTKQKIAFLRRVLERAKDSGDKDLEMIIALAEQIEEALEKILQK